jgi:CheY-like chemotaxis protein
MSENHRKFVLCVDDDMDDRSVISEAIKEVDPSLSVIEATNGREAHQFLQEAKNIGVFPCLILLDMNMPIMNGKETLTEIRKDELLRTIPVAFFSTSSNPHDQSFSRENGAEFVTKPFSYKSILTIMKDLLTRCAS